MSTGVRIKKLRKEFGYTQEELGNLLGVKKSAIQKYESGLVKNIKHSKIEMLASIFNTTPNYILGFSDNSIENIYDITHKKYPLLGTIAAGEPIFADEHYDGYVVAGSEIDADFCLKVKGDSMINARICDGDIVFIKKQSQVNDGDIAAVLVDNEATLKRVYTSSNEIVLIAENPMYKPLLFKNEELNNIRILGKATGFQSIL